MDDFSINNREILKNAFLYSETLSDKGAIFHITSVFRTCLWDIDEAISKGFHSWMTVKIPERIDAMKYHEMI